MRRRAPRSASTAATRLRRLRWLLTALFTVTNALGLVVFAALAVRADATQGRQQLDGELRRVTLAAIQRITFDHDAVSLAGLGNSGLAGTCPGFAVLPGGTDPAFLGLESRGGCVSAPLPMLNRVATQAVGIHGVVVGYVAGSDGRPVRTLAEPFYHSGEAAGAVVATVDAEPEASRHQRMLLLTAGACAILVAGLAIAGHVVSGRAIQPAANTLEQQEVLLAETAHDLRTPVAALRALAEAAQANPSQWADLLPRTVGLAQRMGGIIDDLLVRARLAAGVERLNLQPARLDQLVAGVIESTPTEDGAQILLTAAQSTVYADPTLVQRAVGNLLDNALRHGHRPGQAAVVHVTVADGRVTVADQGAGVDPAVGATAFDRFTTGSGSSGLGLSIVRWIVDAHGGTLTFHNAPTGGAIFEFGLRPIPP